MTAKVAWAGNINLRIDVKKLKTVLKFIIALGIVCIVIYKISFSPIPVNSSQVRDGAIKQEVMGTGTLEARVQAIISAKISGRLAEVLVDQGDRVKKGQLLAKLDDADLAQQVEIAKAEITATKAGIDRIAAEITSAEATVAQARSAHNRMEQLSKVKAVSDQDLDDAIEKRAVAEAQLRRTELAKVEIEHQVFKAEKSLQYYQEKLADTNIYAPFDGLITRRERDPGSVLVPGSSILQIISTDQMWVSAWVDETAMAGLAINQPAQIVFRSEPERFYNGTVARIAPLADRETREFLVDVLITELPKLWAVGQRAEVYIETANKDSALLVPSNAVCWRNGKPGLYISNDKHAQWRNLELGLRGKDMVEVQNGVSLNDVVIWPMDVKSAIVENRAVRTK